MDEFIKVFGSVTLRDVAITIAACAFLYASYRKTKAQLAKYFTKEEEQNKKINEVLSLAEQYPKWRQQSLDAQAEFTTAIDHITKKLNEIEEKNAKRERNKLRDRLLQSYRYYTSKEKNPRLAWSEMEKDSFRNMFKDYEDAGGDGYMHTVVEPEMEALDVIPMHEGAQIAELMQSRR